MNSTTIIRRPAYNGAAPCAACKSCANYGHGCQKPITRAEYEAFNVEWNQNPDCWERDRED